MLRKIPTSKSSSGLANKTIPMRGISTNYIRCDGSPSMVSVRKFPPRVVNVSSNFFFFVVLLAFFIFEGPGGVLAMETQPMLAAVFVSQVKQRMPDGMRLAGNCLMMITSYG